MDVASHGHDRAVEPAHGRHDAVGADGHEGQQFQKAGWGVPCINAMMMEPATAVTARTSYSLAGLTWSTVVLLCMRKIRFRSFK